MIKTLIVDEQALFRAGLRSILAGRDDVVVTAECGGGEEALKAVREVRPGLVLMDLNLRGIGGLETLRRLSRTVPESRIIVITQLTSAPLPAQAVDRGAMGFLDKNGGVDEVLQAVDAVLRGECYLARTVAQELSLARVRQQRGEATMLEQLTPRELEILLMITNGQRNKQISQSLFISAKTVSTHRVRMCEKLGVRTDAELARLAVRHGLIDCAV